ncbi:hypothetical protein RND15_52760, partial [Streptomyces sp. DSM 41529]|nr:hypothetical protein [Streptomyces sp. DSM 41529]
AHFESAVAGNVPETVEEAYASRAGYGAPEWEVAGWVTSYEAIAAGELATVSDAVPTLTGHPAMSFAEYLAANPDSYTGQFLAELVEVPAPKPKRRTVSA